MRIAEVHDGLQSRQHNAPPDTLAAGSLCWRAGGPVAGRREGLPDGRKVINSVGGRWDMRRVNRSRFIAMFAVAVALSACGDGEVGLDVDVGAGVKSDEEGPGVEFPFVSQYVDVHGSRMHYVEEGEGTTVLFLHGNPTSSYLWRNVIPHVSAEARTVAVDLIGFGRSDRPRLEYRFQDHYRYVEGFIEALEPDDLVLVVHDWGSVLGLEYARRFPDRVRAVVMMEALIPPAFPMDDLSGMGAGADLFRRFRDPHEGPRLLQEENVFIEQIVANATVTRSLSRAELDAYRAPFPTPESRFPIYVWPNELPIAGQPARNVEVVERIGEWLAHSSTPKLLLYAAPGAIVPPEAAAWMQANYRNLEAIFVGAGTHYIQEDQPEAIGRNIAMWLRRLAASGEADVAAREENFNDPS